MLGAAFFDLDRTLLAGASGTVYSAAMRRSGFVSRSIPGESLLYGMFNLIGENLPSMAIARQAATFARGRPHAAMQLAGHDAVAELLTLVQPFAWGLFDDHRRAGRQLVMATTTPHDLVAPLAEALEFDDVIATRYGVAADGTFDGTVVGPFVWAQGKLAAVRAWAADHDIELGASYAYSDSVFDTPLLGAVGHPVAVNPDPAMIAMATLRRWPIQHLDAPPGVAKLPVLNIEVQSLVRQLARAPLMPFARFDIKGVERIPAEGPAIVVANHRSYFDVAAIAVLLARSGRTVRFLGKKELFDAPLIGPLARAMGGIRVDRASGEAEPLEAAADALAAGEIVALMPQGTIPRGPAFFEPVLKARHGAARLAQLSDAPVIPIGVWGTEKVWPRSARLPNVLNVTNPPKVRLRVGKPVKVKRKSLQRDTERIMAAIVELLPAKARKTQTPTDAELAATYPPGYCGDPERESDRRPGTD